MSKAREADLSEDKKRHHRGATAVEYALVLALLVLALVAGLDAATASSDVSFTSAAVQGTETTR